MNQSEKNHKIYLNEKAKGGHYFKLGDVKRALVHYRNAYETSFGKEDADLILELAILLEETGQLDDAMKFYRHAIKLDHENPVAYYGLATTCEASEEFEEALELYYRVLELDEDADGIHCAIGNCYSELGQHEEAIENFLEALKRDKTDMPALFGLGATYEATDQTLKAYHYFMRAHKIIQDDTLVLCYLGVVCAKLGQIQSAIKYYELSIAADKYNVGSYANLGQVYESVYGDFDSGIKIYSEGIENNPDEALLYLNRALAYHAKNMPEQATADLDKAMQLDKTIDMSLDGFRKNF